MVDPGVATTVKEVLETVVTSGTGENAATGDPTWGKTGTTDNNGDAWFCGATEEITACVWVGHADTVTPMETEFAGAPVDGGTFPALIFADLVNAYEEVQAAHETGEEPDDDSSTTLDHRTERAGRADLRGARPRARRGPGARRRRRDGGGAAELRGPDRRRPRVERRRDRSRLAGEQRAGEERAARGAEAPRAARSPG